MNEGWPKVINQTNCRFFCDDKKKKKLFCNNNESRKNNGMYNSILNLTSS